MIFKRSLFLMFLIFSLTNLSTAADAPKVNSDEVSVRQLTGPGIPSGYYLFCYFKGDGLDGVHYAVSRDGYKWTPLNNDVAVLPAPIGQTTKKTRDPSIVKGPDGIYRMVWTVAWDGRSFGYAHSYDLIEWRDAQAVPAMQHEPTTRNVWAPEVFYDAKTERFYILWSSTIPGRFSPADEGTSETKYDHRVYFTTTKDFQTFEPTKLYFDPGHNVIDAFLTEKNGVYHLYYKDETLVPAEKKIILEATGPTAEGPFTNARQISAQNWVEGPSAITIGADTVVYYDCYRDGKYGAVRSHNGAEWENVTNLVSFPKGARHGTALRIKREDYEKLVEKFGLTQ